MKVFVINLDRRADRLGEISELMEKIGLKFQRVSAVDGKAIDLSAVARPWLAKWYIGRRLVAGAVGCFLSHRKIWQEMQDKNIPQALIFEDDASLVEWDPRILDIQLSDLDLDILRIGGNHMENLVTRRPLKPTRTRFLDRFLSAEPTAGTGAYIISQAGARKCLAVKLVWFPVDHVDIWSALYGIQTALLYPVMFEPSGSTSDIHPEHKRSSVEKAIRFIYRLPVRVLRRAIVIYLAHFGKTQYS